ncbi:MAG: WecB/TagA/CpsF family glycosyltransferase [Chloroflexi bacterium]|nr:WecB/TagA/CpsF family glycosyltransferase [Chloroflexota bacterium]
MINHVRILGIPVHAFTYKTLLSTITHWLEDGEFHHICTVNPEFAMIAQQQGDFFDLLQRVDACIADGVGLLLAARILGQSLPERVTGTDTVQLLAEQAAAHGWRVYFLGAAEGIAQQASQILQARYPDLQVAGCYAGSPSGEEAPAIINHINASRADILLVAYGAPQQDLWIDRYKGNLNVKLAMGVGGAFDFIAGVVPRAPRWMQRIGLEWLFRLYKQPWRWRRMLRLPLFVLAVSRYRGKAIHQGE